MFPPFFFLGGGAEISLLKKYFLNWKIIALKNFVGFFTFKLQEEWTKTPQDICPVGVRSAEEGGQQGDWALKLEQCQVWVSSKLCCCHKAWAWEELTESQLPSQGPPGAVQPKDHKSGLMSDQASVIETKLIPKDVYSHSCVQSKGDIHARTWACTHTDTAIRRAAACSQRHTDRIRFLYIAENIIQIIRLPLCQTLQIIKIPC